jgi:DNA-binding response OmpR family regulator
VLGQAAADALVEVGFDVALAHDRCDTLSQPDLAAVELVVLDLDYKGKDAWDLVESLLETQPLTPIVFLTSARAGAEWGLVTAVGEMLEKPLPAARLVAAVRRLLAEGTAQRLNRNSSQRMAVRYSRPYVGSPSTAPAYSGWRINE